MVPAPRVSSSSFAAVVAALLAVATVASIVTAPATAGTDAHNVYECDSMFDLEGATMYLPATENTTVTGDSNWSPNEEVSVVLRFGGSSEVVLQNDSVVIDQQGNWEATFDLSELSDNQTFVATVRHQGRIMDEVNGVIGTPSASVTFEDQHAQESGEEVTIREVEMDLGGFVAIHEEKPTGPIIGLSRYLEPGTHTNVTIQLDNSPERSTILVAMPHKDTDCDHRFDFITLGGDGPYVDNGMAVTNAASVRFPTPTPSPSPTPTATPTPSPSPSPTDPATHTATPAGTATTGPGLGIGAALVAIVGGAFLLWRTR